MRYAPPSSFGKLGFNHVCVCVFVVTLICWFAKSIEFLGLNTNAPGCECGVHASCTSHSIELYNTLHFVDSVDVRGELGSLQRHMRAELLAIDASRLGVVDERLRMRHGRCQVTSFFIAQPLISRDTVVAVVLHLPLLASWPSYFPSFVGRYMQSLAWLALLTPR